MTHAYHAVTDLQQQNHHVIPSTGHDNTKNSNLHWELYLKFLIVNQGIYGK